MAVLFNLFQIWCLRHENFHVNIEDILMIIIKMEMLLLHRKSELHPEADGEASAEEEAPDFLQIVGLRVLQELDRNHQNFKWR
jgi:hypothetical protein